MVFVWLFVFVVVLFFVCVYVCVCVQNHRNIVCKHQVIGIDKESEITSPRTCENENKVQPQQQQQKMPLKFNSYILCA